FHPQLQHSAPGDDRRQHGARGIVPRVPPPADGVGVWGRLYSAFAVDRFGPAVRALGAVRDPRRKAKGSLSRNTVPDVPAQSVFGGKGVTGKEGLLVRG